MMVAFSFLFLTALVSTRVVATPAARNDDSLALKKRQTNSEGIHDGFFYSWWSDGGADVNYTNLAGGSYSIEWETGGNFIGGKGWETGSSDRAIKINGTFQVDGNGYLAVYGWTLDPRVEYYIIENYGTYDPSIVADTVTEIHCDDAVYDTFSTVRTGWFPEDTILRYFSVRTEKRTEGIVNTACHFDAWRDADLPLGSHHYQIVATEGYFSSGNARITVDEVGSD